MSQLKITHLIGSLEVGGAERVLCNLAARFHPAQAEMRVITILPEGPLAASLRERGIEVRSLGARSRMLNPLAVARLARLLRRDRPDVLVTWLNHGNLLGGLAARLAGRIPTVWHIRHARLDPRRHKRSTRAVAWCAARSSRWLADRIVFVSRAGYAAHLEQGYPADRSLVVPNGFDLDYFRPDAAVRAAIRRELNVGDEANLVGLFGRFHADKDHANFIRAAGVLRQGCPNVRFVLCGSGVTWDNPLLARWIEAARIRDVCRLLGPRDDTHRLAAALDLTVSSSASEAFPVVVGESMSCGVPCVVTDVGDSADLVGPTGRVVPPGDSEALAAACLDVLSLPAGERRSLGAAARQRIIDHFSFEAISPQYLAVWADAARAAAPRVSIQKLIVASSRPRIRKTTAAPLEWLKPRQTQVA